LTGPAEIRPAVFADLLPARALLAANALPLEGFPDHPGTVWVAATGDRVVGVVALELYPDGALLRSLAVQQHVRGQRLGAQLVAAALDDVRRRDLAVVYLLTTTAETYFARLGFTVVARDAVPDSLLDSIEFRSACPASATAMVTRLD
jgi:N-acetylglutamate synthase-like GNAT family acetyltransferase